MKRRSCQRKTSKVLWHWCSPSLVVCINGCLKLRTLWKIPNNFNSIRIFCDQIKTLLWNIYRKQKNIEPWIINTLNVFVHCIPITKVALQTFTNCNIAFFKVSTNSLSVRKIIVLCVLLHCKIFCFEYELYLF